MDEQLASRPPKDNLRSAISYMTNRWECFTQFLQSGAVPLDNNGSERAVKFPVLGRKAWLFMGSEHGGETAATMFSLTATCRRLHINPLAYLTDIFERLPTCDLNDRESLWPLLPDKWLAAHPEARMEFREEEASARAERKRTHRTARRAAATAATSS
jgi:hypothetical protein